VAFFASLKFVRYIYGSIKMDWAGCRSVAIGIECLHNNRYVEVKLIVTKRTSLDGSLIVPTNVCSPYSCISLNPDLLLCNVD
jgi:hypothetical protein